MKLPVQQHVHGQTRRNALALTFRLALGIAGALGFFVSMSAGNAPGMVIALVLVALAGLMGNSERI